MIACIQQNCITNFTKSQLSEYTYIIMRQALRINIIVLTFTKVKNASPQLKDTYCF